jgi:putative hydrolase of HD superfamily
MTTTLLELFEFFTVAEKLKTELRHSWTSNEDRQESVADHSWMLCLMALSLMETYDFGVDKQKVLQMLIIHDLAEAIVGDIPSFEVSERKKNKLVAERSAMNELTANLSKGLREKILSIWEEMEARETDEAKLAQCIDKAEVLFQHNLADISTWDEGDFSLACWNKDEYFDYSPIMRAFKDHINEQFWGKMERSNSLERLNPEHIERRVCSN